MLFRSTMRNMRGDRPATLPAGFDYDFWLGPAPKRPYEPLRSHGTFRHFWDYSGGTFIDFWCHISDVAFWAMDWKAPTAISAAGGRFFWDDGTETADTMEAILEFPGVLYMFSFRPTPLPPDPLAEAPHAPDDHRAHRPHTVAGHRDTATLHRHLGAGVRGHLHRIRFHSGRRAGGLS